MSGERFRYDGYQLDPVTGRLESRYSLGSWRFTDVVTFELPGAPAGAPPAAALEEAARLVHLLSGVSYYKTAAPSAVDLGTVPTTPAERAFLRRFLVEGLGEFAFRNAIDLSGLSVTGPDRDGAAPASWAPVPGRPLVPFGAGIDSIVTVEAARRTHPDLCLFVVGRGGERFEAIEQTMKVTGLPVARAERHLDPSVLASSTSGFLNGHVPVTGILSSVAVMAAVLGGFDSVVMSNEWSASTATLEVDGRPVNHQWSKGMGFEAGLRDLLSGMLSPPPAYFSFLRSRSELWVARQFSTLGQYHGVFRSCNRAFYTDPALRWDRWCGTCDKCCFIDLVLSPFLPAPELAQIFGGHEPLATRSLAPAFRALLGVGSEPRPFECVGDVQECRAAVLLAAERPDRVDGPMVQELAEWARAGGRGGAGGGTGGGGPGGGGGARPDLFGPLGPDFVPEAFRAGAGGAGDAGGSGGSPGHH